MGTPKDTKPKHVIINDAVHGVMAIDGQYKDLIKGIIDEPVFQRLRHIKQLGMASLVFPSAVHTRFNHCLGMAYVAYRMCENLGLEEQEIKYAIAASLLHDIGHGPMSHAFEGLLKGDKKGDRKVDHEDWTRFFINSSPIHDVLFREGLDIDLIEKFIKGEYKYDSSKDDKDYGVVADIISSQLDADKLDYLLRDSHFSGVEYGKTDLEWILNNLVVVTLEGKKHLGIYRKGWRAVEHMLLCRRIMHQNVYRHHKKEIIEKLMLEFLTQLCEDIKSNKEEVVQEIRNEELKEFLKYVGRFLYKELSKDEFVQNAFPYYRRLTDYDILMLIRDFSLKKNLSSTEVGKISECLYERKLHKTFSFKKKKLKSLRKFISKMKEKCSFLKEWQIFVTEKDIVTYKDSKKLIYVDDGKEPVLDICEHSDLLKSMKGREENDCCLAVELGLLKNNENKIREHFKSYIHFG